MEEGRCPSVVSLTAANLERVTALQSNPPAAEDMRSLAAGASGCGSPGRARGLRRGRERRLSGESRTSFNFEVEVLGEEEVQHRRRASQAHDAVVRQHGGRLSLDQQALEATSKAAQAAQAAGGGGAPLGDRLRRRWSFSADYMLVRAGAKDGGGEPAPPRVGIGLGDRLTLASSVALARRKAHWLDGEKEFVANSHRHLSHSHRQRDFAKRHSSGGRQRSGSRSHSVARGPGTLLRWPSQSSVWSAAQAPARGNASLGPKPTDGAVGDSKGYTGGGGRLRVVGDMLSRLSGASIETVEPISDISDASRAQREQWRETALRATRAERQTSVFPGMLGRRMSTNASNPSSSPPSQHRFITPAAQETIHSAPGSAFPGINSFKRSKAARSAAWTSSDICGKTIVV
jgi:hypothetical protein